LFLHTMAERKGPYGPGNLKGSVGKAGSGDSVSVSCRNYVGKGMGGCTIINKGPGSTTIVNFGQGTVKGPLGQKGAGNGDGGHRYGGGGGNSGSSSSTAYGSSYSCYTTGSEDLTSTEGAADDVDVDVDVKVDEGERKRSPR
jgi:hypothetical protein